MEWKNLFFLVFFAISSGDAFAATWNEPVFRSYSREVLRDKGWRIVARGKHYLNKDPTLVSSFTKL